MTPELTPKSRVRVTVNRNGYHWRSFYGTFIGWTDTGLCKIREDGHNYTRTYSSDNVKKIR